VDFAVDFDRSFRQRNIEKQRTIGGFADQLTNEKGRVFMNNNDNVLSNLLSSGKRQNVGEAERLVSGVAGGALVAYGLKAGGLMGAALSLLGGGLLYRGATGHCQMYDAAGISTAGYGATAREANPSNRVHVKKSVTIDKSAAELYSFWRNFENLPQFMTHLESVKILEGDGKRSHWVAKAPLGQSVEWDADLTSDMENERIGWKSVEGSQIANSGVVEFLPTANRGTEVRVVLTYEPPAGYIGTLIAKLFGEEPNQQVADDLRRFKMLMESGTVMTTEGQPSGRDETAKTVTA
jgi:uncharacterized membrane protein